MQPSEIQAVYERFKNMCKGPTTWPVILVKPAAASCAVGYKSDTYMYFLGLMVEAGFRPMPIGSLSDCELYAMTLKPLKERPTPVGGQIPITFHLNKLALLIEDDLAPQAA